MEKLDIVNKMLININARPINSLDTKQPDATSAIVMLEQSLKKELIRGWWFNTNKNIKYIRDSNGIIELPVNIVSIVPTNKDVILKDNKLYSKYNKSYVFDEDQILEREVLLPEYNEIPMSFKSYIAEMATADFVAVITKDTQREMVLREMAAREYQNVFREQLSTERYNVFDNKNIQERFVGLTPYRYN